MLCILRRAKKPSLTASLVWCGVLFFALPVLCAEKAWPALQSCPAEPCEAAAEDGIFRFRCCRSEERAQHVRLLGADRWQKAGYRGQGVKIAILDSGFRGYRYYLGSALPSRIQIRSFRTDTDLEAKESQHGILCGEVIHALAPDAELLFANWDADRPDEFLHAVRWAHDQGARILSCSLIMPSWSDAEGGGPVHAELSRIIGDGRDRNDLLFFACAGNTAERHWSGHFHSAADGCHQWEPGHEENELTPWSSEEVSVELCSVADARFEVCVDDETSGLEVAHSAPAKRNRGCFAIARFRPLLSHRYGIRVRMAEDTSTHAKLAHDRPPTDFHVVALGGWLHYATARGSIPFPADGPSVVAVGAVDESGHRTHYSSCGPNSRQPKPDLAAPVPFPSYCRDRSFSGTSAAAPQAAALAALWWCRHPDWTAARIREAMYRSARDLGPKGHDFETGYGLIALP
jgi:hypothetical protein